MYKTSCVPFSAGVGRTGVFITLSIVLERMRYEGVVDLFQTVKTLRTQRPAMVQTEVRDRPVTRRLSATGRKSRVAFEHVDPVDVMLSSQTAFSTYSSFDLQSKF